MNETYPQALVGYRYWKVDDAGNLCGVVHTGVWDIDRPTHSRCQRRGHRGPPADNSCSCGLYAYSSTEAAACYQLRHRLRGATIVGVVVGRGDAQIYHDGWRAAEAAVVAVAPLTSKHEQAARAVAQRYHVPFVSSRQELQPIAQTYGHPVVLPSNTQQPGFVDRALPQPKLRARASVLQTIMVFLAMLIVICGIFAGLTGVMISASADHNPVGRQAIKSGVMNDPSNLWTNNWHIASKRTWRQHAQQLAAVLPAHQKKSTAAAWSAVQQKRADLVDQRKMAQSVLAIFLEIATFLLITIIAAAVCRYQQYRLYQQTSRTPPGLTPKLAPDNR